VYDYQKSFLSNVRESFDFSKWVRKELDSFVAKKLGITGKVTPEDYKELEERLR